MSITDRPLVTRYKWEITFSEWLKDAAFCERSLRRYLRDLKAKHPMVAHDLHVVDTCFIRIHSYGYEEHDQGSR